MVDIRGQSQCVLQPGRREILLPTHGMVRVIDRKKDQQTQPYNKILDNVQQVEKNNN